MKTEKSKTEPRSDAEAEVRQTKSPAEESNEPPAGDELQAALAERDANRDRALRAQAELENFRKRVRKEADEQTRYQSLYLSRDLLPVLDNLQRALDAAEQSHNVDELVQGVRMVLDQFETILAGHDVQAIDAVGQPFDPNLHEAIQHMPSPDHPAMAVIQEYRKGYRMHDRVVRPSQVIVSSGPPQEESSVQQADREDSGKPPGETE